MAFNRLGLLAFIEALIFIAILVIGMGKHWNRVALFHGFVAAVVPAGPFLFDGMLISGEYDIDSSSLDTLRP